MTSVRLGTGTSSLRRQFREDDTRIPRWAFKTDSFSPHSIPVSRKNSRTEFLGTRPGCQIESLPFFGRPFRGHTRRGAYPSSVGKIDVRTRTRTISQVIPSAITPVRPDYHGAEFAHSKKQEGQGRTERTRDLE